MAKEILTDKQVELEIERLRVSDHSEEGEGIV